MKKGIITMMALMLGMSGMMAQSTVVVAGAGDVTIRQGDAFQAKCEGEMVTIKNDNKIVLTSYKDYDLTLPTLESIRLTGAGDVHSDGVLNLSNLDVLVSGVGEAILNVECDTIKAKVTGIGDLNLTGHCRYLEATVTGLGDVDLDNFVADSLNINKTESRDVHVSLPEGPVRHDNLLFDPNWNGFEAGLNMLLGPGPSTEFTGQYALLEQRPWKSWVYNFNIVDIGVAFTRSHRAGIYTGIGLSWNTFRFTNPVRLEKGDDQLICNLVDESVEGYVKKSKLGVLYLQAPLMIEVRPTRKFFIAVGVTGGIRVDSWNKIKFEDRKIKTHKDFYINRFKLDASLRAGRDEGLGFFANFNLLPFFAEGKAQDAHCLSFGFSLNF
ncbi:MAG: DUF2807 domain-containing protein [Bacteroidales bacterium]|nr:DUF2807 domain-containing protein [Bacteroidales bacterium]